MTRRRGRGGMIRPMKPAPVAAAAAAAGDYQATGGGTAAANQWYAENGTVNGKPAYQGVTDDSYWLEWSYDGWGESWIISTNHNAPPPNNVNAYYVNSTASVPPEQQYSTGGSGSAPGATVAAA